MTDASALYTSQQLADLLEQILDGHKPTGLATATFRQVPATAEATPPDRPVALSTLSED